MHTANQAPTHNHDPLITTLLPVAAGEAGAGKTQLVLQALLAVQLPQSMGGVEGSALYIYTEGGAPLQRLTQLWQARYAR